MTRRLFAVHRCAVLGVLTLAAFVYVWFVVVAATVVVLYPLALAGQFRLAGLIRRLARAWCGADLAEPQRRPPSAPRRRDDGWYAHGNSLFKSPAVPTFLLKVEQYGKDPSTHRELWWMLRAPFTGGLAVLAPPAAIVGGALLLAGWPGFPRVPEGWRLPAALGALLGAALLAPAALRAYGRWTTSQLQASALPRRWRRSPLLLWIHRTTWTGVHLAGLAGISLAVFAGQLLNLLVLLVGGLLLLPVLAGPTRSLVGLYRRYAVRWTGARLPAPYRPFPQPPDPSEDGTYRVGRLLYTDVTSAIQAQRPGWALGDPATWRDQLWAWGSLLLALPSLLPLALLGVGFFGPFWLLLWWPVWAVPYGVATGRWVTPFYLWSGLRTLWPAAAWVPDWLSPAVGLVVAGLGLVLTPPLLRLRRWWDRALLTPAASTLLASRVAHLTTTRADAVDVQAAELRRIERDLHDGAQARLIAVGLGLGAVSRLLATDPERARQVLAQAQETSAAALAELRSLVRGIHPPVLAERGLGDAVRAIALDTPLPVSVDVDLPGRLPAPVESAAYFAACEALANAARHATHVRIVLSHRSSVLRIVVTDDGSGGADPATGTGLRGIGRRLGAFDGTVTVDSPSGGPTVVTLEIPCASSSPKTSTC